MRSQRKAGVMWEGRPVISVADLPGNGLYVRHLGNPEGVDGVHRTTVTLPGRPRTAAIFSAAWLRAHLDMVDVVHVHGLPARQDLEGTSAAVDVVLASGKPLVVTAYHLRDPSGGDAQPYAARLDALIPRADAVITLTETAAREVHRRWGVEAILLPHPHVVDFVRMWQRRGPRGSPLRVGVHLGGLHVAADPVRLVGALVRAVRAVGDTDLVINAHAAIADPGSTDYAPICLGRIRRLADDADTHLHLQPPLATTQLWNYLSSLDVSVVPESYGSHSIWPEACTDLGTRALMPAGTHAAEQQPCLTYPADASLEVQADALAEALRTVRQQGAPRPGDPRWRWTQRVQIAGTLRAVYERVLDPNPLLVASVAGTGPAR